MSFPTAGADLRWHKLTLAAAWSSSQGTYRTGDPEYAVSGPVTYLSGSMHYTSGGSAVFADIPKAAQSVHELIRQVYTYAGSTGGITLAPSFGIASSNPPSLAQGYTSLAGISYLRNS